MVLVVIEVKRYVEIILESQSKRSQIEIIPSYLHFRRADPN